ncbi:MAG: hypothetical protein HC918_06025 [Oscillatoriales cyanobacterium SM2_1_8]|nr:hypothetical protein [Oscillatoriales cyanobacterium SM2_1_8]
MPAADSFVLYGRVSGIKQPEWQRTGKLDSNGFIMVELEDGAAPEEDTAVVEREETTEPDLVTVTANGTGELAVNAHTQALAHAKAGGHGDEGGGGTAVAKAMPAPAIARGGRKPTKPMAPRHAGSAIVAIAGGTVLALAGIGYTGSAAWQVQRVQKVAALNAIESPQGKGLQEHTERLRLALEGLDRVPNLPLFPYENAQKELVVARGRLEMLEKAVNGAEAANRDLQKALALAQEAAVLVQKPPHPLAIWQKAQGKWQEAIALLAGIPEGTEAYGVAQERLQTYRANAQQVGIWVNRLQGSQVLPQFFAALPPDVQTEVLGRKESGMARDLFVRECFAQIMPTVRQQANAAPVNTYPSPANFGVRLCEHVLANPVTATGS